MNNKKLQELQLLLEQGEAEHIPYGYYSRHQIAGLINRSLVTADRFIYRCIETGTMKRVLIRRPTAAGIRPVPYFSLPSASELRPNKGLGIQGQLSKVRCIQTRRKKTPRQKRLR